MRMTVIAAIAATLCIATSAAADSEAPQMPAHAISEAGGHQGSGPLEISSAGRSGNVCAGKVCVRVAPSARAALQCVVDHVQGAGVRIKYMRGFGRGTVRGSRHPDGNALDINQTGRNRTSPHVPPSVSNAAADKCGVISGARWGHADNGHWNLPGRVAGYHGKRRRAAYASAIPVPDRFTAW